MDTVSFDGEEKTRKMVNNSKMGLHRNIHKAIKSRLQLKTLPSSTKAFLYTFVSHYVNIRLQICLANATT